MCRLRAVLPLLLPLLLLLLAVPTDGTATYPGTCPKPESVKNFQRNRFNGSWYLFLTDEKPGSKSPEKCSVMTFNSSSSGGFDFTDSTIIDGKWHSDHGHVSLPTNGRTADLIFNVNGHVFQTRIIGLQYDRVAIFWDCNDLPGQRAHRRDVNIFTRHGVNTEGLKQSMKVLMKLHGYEGEGLTEVDQSNCQQ